METASVGATSAGAIAPVAQPLAPMLSRTAIGELDKYKTMKTKTKGKRSHAGR